ncbi:type IV pilus assembly PilZ [Methylorubrum populi]|uniref:Type IV pilus assembly PilZ n=2 Tax=Methylorubrum populi TaxID=223967 RepID=A0A160PKV9_9HYPH|nr:type IV pilus assembly PilZ [Methylorubrum populi]
MDRQNIDSARSGDIGLILPHSGKNIWCRVEDRAEFSARLSVNSVLGVPERFVLVIVDTGERFLAETVRKEAWKLSVRLRAAPLFGSGVPERAPASETIH